MTKIYYKMYRNYDFNYGIVTCNCIKVYYGI